MIFNKLIIFLFLYSFSFTFSNIKEYIYDVEIKGVSIVAGTIGKCSLKIRENINEQYEIDILTKTVNFAKLLYPYRDQIKLKVDKDFSLISINHKSTNDDLDNNIQINRDDKVITKNGKNLNFFSDSLYSPYSIIPLMQTKELNIDDEYFYEIFSSKKIKNVMLKVLKIEKIKVPYGIFECIAIKPVLDKNAIKNNGDLELWYTNDNEKIPVKIKLNTKIGTFIMKLKKFKNE